LRASALIGSVLIALLLTGSSKHSATSLAPVPSLSDAGVFALNAEGKRLAASSRLADARALFLMAAAVADSAGDARAAAMNRNNAGFCEVATMQYAAAFRHLSEARDIAEKSGQMVPLIYTLNSIASLYVAIGDYESALSVARAALHGPAGRADAAMRALLMAQISKALAHQNKLDEAEPYQRNAISHLTEEKRFADVARLQAAWGEANIKDGRLADAEDALQAGLKVVEQHHLDVRTSFLAGFANLERARHRPVEAARYFEQALALPEDRLPRWKILNDRARFRMETGDERGALADFRQVNAIAARLRLDMVPADQDRVAFENGIGEHLRAFVGLGNRIASRTGDAALMEETFNAAAQSRLWSLRTLLPSSTDWRSHLSAAYWEKLGRYQQLQRKALATDSDDVDEETSRLRLDLQQMEAAAGSRSATPGAAATSALKHARALLDGDTVLFSFHISPEGGWVWAVDRGGVSIYALPPEAELRRSVEAFAVDLNPAAGHRLYSQLFGRIPAVLTSQSRWLLELDGPLHDVPFAALAVSTGSGSRGGAPAFLVEHHTLQTIPGSSLLENRPFTASGRFVGIGDPVYNAADTRFRGSSRTPEYSLPRLTGTEHEVAACARAWRGQDTHLLTGTRAAMEEFRGAAASGASILHFATHVVPGTGDYRSGLIALSLNRSGEMELLGPREILAGPVPADLVVMNGCHSSQGESVPSNGRMGLTRAWIGAGAGSVLATQWDIRDTESEQLMVSFYTALRKAPGRGFAQALREAQLEALRADSSNIRRWAGYYLLSRTL
jgi:CHAT domain-containing protein/tetratricopeptide (TPR) repeat protein